MTQTDAILALLRSRGAQGLTPMDALREAGTMRLAARISDLRADGHVITTEIVTTPNGKRVARYVLKEPRRLTWDDLLHAGGKAVKKYRRDNYDPTLYTHGGALHVHDWRCRW